MSVSGVFGRLRKISKGQVPWAMKLSDLPEVAGIVQVFREWRLRAMAAKSHKTALVVIPPGEVWEPLQAIRRRHDRQTRRWMPHVNLIYPFRPEEDLAGLYLGLERASCGVRSFELELASLQHFHHGRSQFTLWLAPEPRAPLIRLHNALWRIVPDCDDVRRHGGGFTPHLGVGQVRGRPKMLRMRDELQAGWQKVRFRVREVSLIRRGDPPDDVFRVLRVFALG
jgi:2'-5' RNA ligase